MWKEFSIYNIYITNSFPFIYSPLEKKRKKRPLFPFFLKNLRIWWGEKHSGGCFAGELIKSKPGNMVRGVDSNTLDGLPISWFNETSKQLNEEKYKPKPSRRVYIPKANGKLRPLGISSPRDKIVQQAFKIVMEMVLEPKFLDSSHGFRPRRGCHSARPLTKFGHAFIIYINIYL